MAELLTIRQGQTLLRLSMRFVAESLDGFASAKIRVKPPAGDPIERDAVIEFDSSLVYYQWDAAPAADGPFALGIYTYIVELTDAEGRTARSRHAHRFRVVEEFAT